MAAKLPAKTTDRVASLGMAAVQVKASQDHLVAQIRKAHDEGMSLRAIATAAALSHEQVRRIVNQA